MIGVSFIVIFVGQLFLTNYISYHIMKRRVLERRIWDLNICCGKTDGGGVNADIVKHSSVPNFYKIDNIYQLPFTDKYFQKVLCSHTIEHVDDPQDFYQELSRVGNEVKLVVPPLWDLSAALNLLEHKWLFLTFKKEHSGLPAYIKLPLAGFIQKLLGQKIKA